VTGKREREGEVTGKGASCVLASLFADFSRLFSPFLFSSSLCVFCRMVALREIIQAQAFSGKKKKEKKLIVSFYFRFRPDLLFFFFFLDSDTPLNLISFLLAGRSYLFHSVRY
jgi:hypothetical protein